MGAAPIERVVRGMAVPVVLLALHGLLVQTALADFTGRAGFRHAASLLLAAVGAWLLSRLTGPKAWATASLIALAALGGLLIVLFLPPIRGAHSWIPLGVMTLQPSELAKAGLIFANSIFLGARGGRGIGPGGGLLWVGVSTAVVAGLVIIQPDLGTAIVITGVSWVQTALSRAPKAVTLGIPVALLAVLIFAGPSLLRAVMPHLKPHQQSRIEAFLDPQGDPEGANWQVNQAHMQMAAGGWLGTGFDRRTREELKWLPERHNDFVFAVVGRTGGFMASAAVLALYAWAVLAAFGAARELPEGSARHLCVGLGAYLGVHAALNVAVVTALVPATGFPLVPLSAGGSSLLGLGTVLGLAAAGYRADAAAYNRRIPFSPRGTV